MSDYILLVNCRMSHLGYLKKDVFGRKIVSPLQIAYAPYSLDFVFCVIYL